MNEEPIDCLTVFYDPNCGLCRTFRSWLEEQPLWVAVRFVGYDSPEALRLMPEIGSLGADKECVVLAGDGHWWQGPDAWLVCLWATKAHRLRAHDLASPRFRPFLRRIVHGISQHRLSLSKLLGLRSERQIEAEVAEFNCPEGSCRLPTLRTAKEGVGA
ncbi:hypothetical protein HAHE_42990 [Haloferula helveola]|uniref:DUF393 domain-containing protein n=1 Tax=Haloferula helveola TaxID=490095 RepID=A0ABM7RF64_9BACT|nr:hypothetical protein HAHE_42990 [Haloferula helveola]